MWSRQERQETAPWAWRQAPTHGFVGQRNADSCLCVSIRVALAQVMPDTNGDWTLAVGLHRIDRFVNRLHRERRWPKEASQVIGVRVKWLGLLGIAGAPGAICAAQRAGPARPVYTLVGRVVDSAGTAVPQAQIELLASGLVVARLRSDTTGHFRARDIGARVLHVSVRRLGFEPDTVTVQVPADRDQTDVQIVLAPAAVQLSATEVLAEHKADIRLHSFYERQADNKYGSYIAPATIERRQPMFISELLRSVPGVKVQPSARAGNRVTIRGCAPVVWVDGARMQDAQVDDVVEPQDVAAIEIYRSFSGLPSQYFDRSANCGTIIVWTKIR